MNNSNKLTPEFQTSFRKDVWNAASKSKQTLLRLPGLFLTQANKM